MRWAERVVGLLLLAALLASLPLLLRLLGRRRELSVAVASPRPRAVLPASSSPLPPSRPHPTELLPDLHAPRPVPTGPGLSLQTWSVSYGSRWLREVSLPVWSGPFDQEGTTTNCGFLVRIGAALFDPKQDGSPLAAEADRAARAAFPVHYEMPGVTVTLPAVQKTELSVSLEPGVLRVSLRATLVDGTLIAASAPLGVEIEQGKLRLRRKGLVQAQWSGPSRQELEQNPLVAGASMLDRMFGGGNLVDRVAQGEVSKQADRILSQLSVGLDSLSDPWAPFPERPKDSIRLLLGGAPSIGPEGVTLPICPAIVLSSPRRDASMPWIPRISAPPPSLPPPSGPGDAIEIAVDEGGLNLLLYMLWQSSHLQQLGRSSQLLASLPAATEQLAFSVEGFDPRLPPLVVPDRSTNRGGLRVLVGDVRLGSWGKREVIGHGELRATLEGKGSELVLNAQVEQAWANCSEAVPGGVVLTPCLSDLLPVIRDELGRRPTALHLDGGWLLTALSARSFARFRVETGTPEVSTDAKAGGVRARVRARLLAPR